MAGRADVTIGDPAHARAMRWRTGWLIAYVPLTFFAFPERLGDTVVDAGVWLGPVSITSLVLGVAGHTPRRAAAHAFWAGWLAHAAVLHWIYVVTVRYGGAPPLVGVLAVLAISVYPALATAGIGAAIGWLGRRGLAGPVALATVVALADHLQSFVATGFPWALLGHTQLGNAILLPLARYGAVYLVGFGAALTGTLLAAAVLALRGGSRSSGRPLRGLAAGAAIWVALHVAGLLAGAHAIDPEGARPLVRIAALQGSIEQGRKWSPDQFERTLARYEVLTRAAAADGAELIVWPETAVPGVLEFDRDTASRVAGLAREEGVALIVGAVGVAVEPGGGRVTDWYDSAFLIEPDGGLAGRYDKSHLVPFGEYVPLRGLLGAFVVAIAPGVASGDVSEGPGPVAMRLYVPGPRGSPGGAVRVGVPICYELLFPDLVRRFVHDDAELLVAITNDAWYGRSGAPHQFLAITAMRAAETGVALVRSANTGVSAIIDARGHVEAESELFERGFVIGDVALRGERAATFYAAHGDVFVYGCWAGMALWLAVRLGLNRRD